MTVDRRGDDDDCDSPSASRSVSQSISQSISHSVSQSNSQSVSQSVIQSVSQTISQSVSQSVSFIPIQTTSYANASTFVSSRMSTLRLISWPTPSNPPTSCWTASTRCIGGNGRKADRFDVNTRRTEGHFCSRFSAPI